ncbi:maleylacetate reductase [Pseudonocardia sp. MH-G8]|uniref:maleylacetate reductase n=1 Tax=Pseudonocardia sp. MH-G8 TaxID=1854588 RepID=UPI000B9FE86A|nr:maleylacetate reductase [Pseudonocardia sp. MH-G8]OZM80832.1 maleylacetate reductase [Pseudonocardia sp. MH-G8]
MSLRTFAHPGGGVYNATPDRVVFGPGSIAMLPDEVDRLGMTRPLVVTTPGRAEMGKRIVAALGDRCAGILPEAVSQVPIELARRGRERAAEMGADCLISVGGGAATGLCKGIAFESGLPIIAVPTTYSGSEMTAYCGMTIDGVKHMHESPAMLASVVIYDAELSRQLPVAVTAASAMNALAHCIDAAYLPSVSPLLLPAAIEGARVVAGALPSVLAAPDDLAARNDLLYGAYLGGAALTGGFALQHAVAHMLGGSFGVEHGLAHAAVLPYVTAHLVERAPVALGRVAQAMGTDDLPGLIWDVAVAAKLPVRLSDVGIRQEDLEVAIRIASAAESYDVNTSLDPSLSNPAPVTEAVVRSVLSAAAAGDRPGPSR